MSEEILITVWLGVAGSITGVYAILGLVDLLIETWQYLQQKERGERW